MKQVLGRGAEARVELVDGVVRKVRSAKAYRHPVLDRRLRQFRTRREAKVLSQLGVASPSLIRVDDSSMVIEMSYVSGEQLRDVLVARNAQAFARKLGVLVRELHDAGVCHGDLTTSNVLVVDEELFFVDFGLAQFSSSVEDQAVDLHLLKHSLAAKHPSLALWDAVLSAYSPSAALLERFEEVELRGRYKKH